MQRLLPGSLDLNFFRRNYESLPDWKYVWWMVVFPPDLMMMQRLFETVCSLTCEWIMRPVDSKVEDGSKGWHMLEQKRSGAWMNSLHLQCTIKRYTIQFKRALESTTRHTLHLPAWVLCVHPPITSVEKNDRA
ncbi:uncharacterized protein LOC116200902 isoform X2 [Punica granatum]|uniref:Uncharacterized protein LOC116200902 isoform X2 n=1 Tax=Punica granatum TaxID=22663 RepID=A0A6P8D8X8_PUNGR|nr:uncharacterized protein LOC116200902 isoform X2 [Punica granatum]